MVLESLCRVQTALLSAGYNITLKVKQVICLESLCLRKDLFAVLATGYGKPLVFQVLHYVLKERNATKSSSNALLLLLFYH